MCDIDRVLYNVKNSFKEELAGQKAWWLKGFPYAIAATICWALNEQVVLVQPPTKVTWVASKTLNVAMIGFIIAGAYAFLKALDKLEKKDATLQGRKFEKIEVSKEERDIMKTEIDSLKQD